MNRKGLGDFEDPEKAFPLIEEVAAKFGVEERLPDRAREPAIERGLEYEVECRFIEYVAGGTPVEEAADWAMLEWDI